MISNSGGGGIFQIRSLQFLIRYWHSCSSFEDKTPYIFAKKKNQTTGFSHCISSCNLIDIHNLLSTTTHPDAEGDRRTAAMYKSNRKRSLRSRITRTWYLWHSMFLSFLSSRLLSVLTVAFKKHHCVCIKTTILKVT
jgi:hypothetical protein